MRLKVNKRWVKVGDLITVNWNAEGTVSPRIIMHMGRRETALAVPDSGEKKFRLKDARGSHWIGLKVWQDGQEKLIRHRIFVYGKSQTGDSFEYMDRKDSWWCGLKTKMSRWWNCFTPEKKRLYILLLLLITYQTLFSFMLFTACHLLLTGIIFWLFWQIIRRN